METFTDIIARKRERVEKLFRSVKPSDLHLILQQVRANPKAIIHPMQLDIKKWDRICLDVYFIKPTYNKAYNANVLLIIDGEGHSFHDAYLPSST